MADPSRLVFSPQAALVVPHAVTDCQGALVKGNHDEEGHPQVVCSFIPGQLVQPTPPPSGFDSPSAIVLSPADARPLARELERAAEQAEKQ
jgi:hypothetical protein